MDENKGYYDVLLENIDGQKMLHVEADIYHHDQLDCWVSEEPIFCYIPLGEAVLYGISGTEEWDARRVVQYDDVDIECYGLDHRPSIPQIPIGELDRLFDLPEGEYALVYKM